MKKISNITDLINDLTDVYAGLRKKKITSNEANSAANVASKIMKGAQVKLSYNQFLNDKTPIQFLAQ